MSDAKVHKCSLCAYASKRAFNLKRHILLVHSDTEDATLQGFPTSLQGYECNDCGKVFTNKRSVDTHKCSATQLICSKCRVIFNNRYQKYRHFRTCDGEAIYEKQVGNGQTTINNTINNNTTNHITNNTTNNITNNNIHITNNINLTFPYMDDDESFRFLHDHIDGHHFKQIWDHKNIERCFTMWARAILSRDENFILSKKNLKERFALIHMGDGHWQYADDNDVFPTVTHELSCSALESTEKHQNVKLKNSSIPHIRSYVDAVNTGVEGKYEDAIQRTKMAVVSITQQKEKEQRTLLGANNA